MSQERRPELVRDLLEGPKRREERTQKLHQLRSTAVTCLEEKGKLIPRSLKGLLNLHLFPRYMLTVPYSDREGRTVNVKVFTRREADLWNNANLEKAGIFVKVEGSGEYLCIEPKPGQSWIHVDGEYHASLTDERIALYQELLDDISGR